MQCGAVQVSYMCGRIASTSYVQCRDQSCSMSAAVPFAAPLLSAAAALAVLLSAAGALLVGDLTSFHVDVTAWMRAS